MGIFNTYTNDLITAGGGTLNVDIHSNSLPITIGSVGSITLLAAYNVTPIGTPKVGTQVRIYYSGNTNLITDTATGKHISFFGNIITDNQAKGQLQIDLFWDGTQWRSLVLPNFNTTKVPVIENPMIVENTIEGSKIKNANISLDKLANVTQGSLLIGDGSNRPVEVSVATDKSILIGNGVSATPRVISGDITVSNTGVATIGAGKVTESMLSFTLADMQYEDLEISSAQLLDLYNTSITIIPAQGTNTLIVPVEAWAFLDYNATTYASGGTVNLTLNSVTVGTLASTAVTAASDMITKFDLSTAVSNGSILNKSLNITNSTGVFTTGDSPLKIRIIYKVLNFA